MKVYHIKLVYEKDGKEIEDEAYVCADNWVGDSEVCGKVSEIFTSTNKLPVRRAHVVWKGNANMLTSIPPLNGPRPKDVLS